MLIVYQSLDFYRRPSETLIFLSQFPITLGGKTILVDFMVIEDPLDFNMFLGCYYVYAMHEMVYRLFV